MRARTYQDGIRIDLIRTEDQAAEVIRLVTGSGIWNAQIHTGGADDSFAVDVPLPYAEDATNVLALLLEIVSALRGLTAEEAVAQWRPGQPDITTAAERFRSTL